MPKFMATSAIKHDGKNYKKDSAFECSASEGKRLITSGVARPIKEKKKSEGQE